jgi:hypothetical protein
MVIKESEPHSFSPLTLSRNQQNWVSLLLRHALFKPEAKALLRALVEKWRRGAPNRDLLHEIEVYAKVQHADLRRK